jgi:hypothetical protein
MPINVTTAPPSNPVAQLSLELPSGNVTGATAGKGWAFRCGGTVANHTLIVDSVARSGVTFTTGVARTDVTTGCSPAIANTVGFTFTLNPSALGLSPGAHTLQIRVTDDLGRTATSNTLSINYSLPSGPPTSILRALDGPSGPVTGPTTGRGWAYRCGGSIVTHELVVDDVVRSGVVFTTGIARPDEPPNCTPAISNLNGFTFTLNPSALGLSVGFHEVKVRVTDDLNRTALTNGMPIFVR